MTENATATFVAIAIPWACRKCSRLKWSKFSFNIGFIRSPGVDVGTGRLG